MDKLNELGIPENSHKEAMELIDAVECYNKEKLEQYQLKKEDAEHLCFDWERMMKSALEHGKLDKYCNDPNDHQPAIKWRALVDAIHGSSLVYRKKMIK